MIAANMCFMVDDFRGLFVRKEISRSFLLGKHRRDGFCYRAIAPFLRADDMCANFFPHFLFVFPAGRAWLAVANHDVHHAQGIIERNVVLRAARLQGFVDEFFPCPVVALFERMGKMLLEIMHEFLVSHFLVFKHGVFRLKLN